MNGSGFRAARAGRAGIGTGGARWRAALFGLLALAPLACLGARPDPLQPLPGSARFSDASWDEGMAVVATFEGRLKRYGTWRAARVHDYLVREYLDPNELTKRDVLVPGLVPVLKANRLIEFTTGTYDYRLMSTLFFRRAGGALYKGVGTCLNACGLVYQRWDEPSGRLRWDSYWEGEGRAESPLAAGDWRFADELPFIALELDDGARVRVLPPLASPRAILMARDDEAEFEAPKMWLGIGDQCTDCLLLPDAGEAARSGPGTERRFPAPPARTLIVQREGLRTRLLDAVDGTLALELVHDSAGFLQAWTLPEEQEFRRVASYRGPYWERTANSDRRLVEAR